MNQHNLVHNYEVENKRYFIYLQLKQVDEECLIENEEENLQKSQQNKNRNPGEMYKFYIYYSKFQKPFLLLLGLI